MPARTAADLGLLHGSEPDAEISRWASAECAWGPASVPRSRATETGRRCPCARERPCSAHCAHTRRDTGSDPLVQLEQVPDLQAAARSQGPRREGLEGREITESSHKPSHTQSTRAPRPGGHCGLDQPAKPIRRSGRRHCAACAGQREPAPPGHRSAPDGERGRPAPSVLMVFAVSTTSCCQIACYGR